MIMMSAQNVIDEFQQKENVGRGWWDSLAQTENHLVWWSTHNRTWAWFRLALIRTQNSLLVYDLVCGSHLHQARLSRLIFEIWNSKPMVFCASERRHLPPLPGTANQNIRIEQEFGWKIFKRTLISRIKACTRWPQAYQPDKSLKNNFVISNFDTPS